MEKNNRELFESMPIRKALLKMAIPTVIGQLIALVYNLADTFFIGRTGNPFMVAAVSLSFPLMMAAIAISNLFGTGGGSQMARLSGRHQDNFASSTCSYSIYASFVVSIIYSVLVFVFLNPILRGLGASEDTITFTRQYMIIVVVLGNLPSTMSMTIAHILRNAGFSKKASTGLSMGGILNIVLDPLLMFVLLPSGYEIVGAALATLLSNTIACFYLLVTIRKLSKNSVLSTSIRDACSITKENRKAIYFVGIPSSSLNALYDITMLILTSLMAKHGDFQLAAIGMVIKIERIPHAINIGLAQGMLPIVAFNYSSGNIARRKEAQNLTRTWIILVCAVTVLFYQLSAGKLCRLFLNVSNNNSETALKTIGYAVLFLRIRCFQSLPQAFNFYPSYILQAMGKGKETLIHSVCRQLVFIIPLLFILNYFFGEIGLVSAVLVGEIMGAILAYIFVLRAN